MRDTGLISEKKKKNAQPNERAEAATVVFL